MKKHLLIAGILILFIHTSNSQQTVPDTEARVVSAQKSNIYSIIVSDVVNKAKIDSGYVFVSLNTAARNVMFRRGIAHTGVHFGVKEERDTAAVEQSVSFLRKQFRNMKFRIEDETPKERNLTIDGVNFPQQLGGKLTSTNRLYIEIGKPVAGWENVALYQRTVNGTTSEKALHRRFYSDTLRLPVYFYYVDKKGNIKEQTLLYQFKMTDAPPKLNIVFLRAFNI